MFCRYCGNELPEDANFCPNCGKINEMEGAAMPRTETVDPMEGATKMTFTDPFEKEKDKLSGSILTTAILSLAFSFTFLFSWVGLVFAIISRVKVSSYVEQFGETEGRASVGKGLGIGGLITSIVMSAIFLLYVVILVSVIVTTA